MKKKVNIRDKILASAMIATTMIMNLGNTYALSASDYVVYETSGTFDVEPTDSGTKYLIYGKSSSSDKIIVNIGDGTGSYSFTPSTTSGASFILADRFNDAEVNGNIKFTQNQSTSVQTYGVDAYSAAKLVINGNFLTSLSGKRTNGYSAYVIGVLSEAASQIDINGKVEISGINATIETDNTNRRSEAVGLSSLTMDGDVGAGNEGKSVLNVTSDEVSKIENIISTNNTGYAIATAITANGQGNTKNEESEVNIFSPMVIDNVSATGSEELGADSVGLLSSILGVINIKNDLEIKNISSSSNEAYAVFAEWGGNVNINADEDSTVKIDGDVGSHSCYSDESDASLVILKLTDKDSYLKGAIIKSHDEVDEGEPEDPFGNINLTLKNGATWYVLNSNNPAFTSNEVSVLNIDNGSIDMSDTEDQVVNIANMSNGNGNISMSLTDKLNVENLEGENSFKVTLVGDTDEIVNKIDEKAIFASTKTDNISFSFDDLVIGSDTYKLYAESVENEETGMFDWVIKSEKVEVPDEKKDEEKTDDKKDDEEEESKKDSVEEEVKEEVAEKEESLPDTGDNITVYVAMFTLSCVVIALILTKKIGTRKNSEK